MRVRISLVAGAQCVLLGRRIRGGKIAPLMISTWRAYFVLEEWSGLCIRAITGTSPTPRLTISLGASRILLVDG